MKKIIFLIFSSLILLFTSVSAQKQNVYFLKNNGDYLKNADSADFIRMVQEPEKKSKLYLVKEFYISGMRKSVGYSSILDPPLYEGRFISFYENGKKKQISSYVKGKITDTAYNHFPNGTLHSTLYYEQIGDSSSIVNVKSVHDSTGVATVTDGNGYAVLYDEDFKYVTGKGNVKNGKYDGEWTGELRTTDTLRYKEVYAEGKMLSGTSTDGKGNVYHYTVSNEEPKFKGGIKLFYQRVLRGFNGRELAQKGIQGMALVKGVILTNGEISDVHVINDADHELAAEAIRVVKAQKGWQPAHQKGRLVNMSRTFPISFHFSQTVVKQGVVRRY